MSAVLKQGILSYIPNYWQMGGRGDYEGRFYVHESSAEFDDVKTAVCRAQKFFEQEIETVERVQNVILYGQFICREQYMTTLYTTFKVVRKFLVIPKTKLRDALKYNLDPRRLGYQELVFKTNLQNIDESKVLLVILVLTQQNLNNNFSPRCSSDYYIEYIIQF